MEEIIKALKTEIETIKHWIDTGEKKLLELYSNLSQVDKAYIDEQKKHIENYQMILVSKEREIDKLTPVGEYPNKPKIDIVICVDDSSDNEDLGMSGIVLYGRHDLLIGKEYKISRIPWDADRNVPNNKNKTWTKNEFAMVRWGWWQVYLGGISHSVFLHDFTPKED